jgi:hypothetical protein
MHGLRYLIAWICGKPLHDKPAAKVFEQDRDDRKRGRAGTRLASVAGRRERPYFQRFTSSS